MFTTLTPFAHFFDDVKSKREVFNFEKIDKTLKIHQRGQLFKTSENRGIKNLLFSMISCCKFAVGGQFWSHVIDDLKKVCKPCPQNGSLPPGSSMEIGRSEDLVIRV